jgi:hypothetical protein
MKGGEGRVELFPGGRRSDPFERVRFPKRLQFPSLTSKDCPTITARIAGANLQYHFFPPRSGLVY